MTTTHRAQSTNSPIRAQIIKALRDQCQDLRVGDGYSYDYNWAEVADDAAAETFASFEKGNSLLITDLGEALETSLRSDLDENILNVSIESLVRDATGEKRYVVVARQMADIVKAFFNFKSAQNGILIGPAWISDKDWWDQGNETYGVTCSAKIVMQSDDGDAFSVT